MDELYARLEKQIPALRLQIRQLYQSFDGKFHLHGASVPVTFWNGGGCAGVLYAGGR